MTHVDGTGRLQTVSKEQNDLYWNLINEFRKFQHNIVGDVRGLGLLIGIELVSDQRSKKPFKLNQEVGKFIASKSLDKGVKIYGGQLVIPGNILVRQRGTKIHPGDHVDIGAGCTIDRGTFNATVIGEGCILDNQVQVGHNCILGRWVVLCGQVGLGGSTEVEDGVVFGGKSGSGGHVRIGAGAKVAGGSAVLSDVAAGVIVSGHPATDFHLDQRGKALLRRMARKKETASR